MMPQFKKDAGKAPAKSLVKKTSKAKARK